MSRNWTPQQKNAIYATDGSVLVSVAAWSTPEVLNNEPLRFI